MPYAKEQPFQYAQKDELLWTRCALPAFALALPGVCRDGDDREHFACTGFSPRCFVRRCHRGHMATWPVAWIYIAARLSRPVPRVGLERWSYTDFASTAATNGN